MGHKKYTKNKWLKIFEITFASIESPENVQRKRTTINNT